MRTIRYIGGTPGRLRTVLAACAVVLSLTAVGAVATGCASSGLSVKQKVVVDVLQPTHDALANFQDLEIATFKAGTLPQLTADVHRQIEARIGVAFRDHAIAARAVKAWKAGDPTPLSVTQLQNDVNNVLSVVRAFVPATDRLTTLIQVGVDAVAQVLLQLKGA